MKPSHRLCLLVHLCLVLPLAACSGLRSSEVVAQTYVLQAGAAALPADSANRGELPGDTAQTLAIARPVAASGLDTDRIAVLRADGRFDAFSASRWAGNLPDVLQTALIDTQRASGSWRAVFADTAPFSTEQLLQIEVRQFQAEYGASGPPVVHVTLEGTLGQRSKREVLRTLHAESRVSAKEDRMGPVIAAFNAALADALVQLRAQLPH
jgi:cholesterol transport system auxiliary component